MTARHVFEQFVSDRASCNVRGVQIGNVGFNPEERLICSARDKKIDIVTFRITPEEIAETGKKVVPGADAAWPPPPNLQEAVFFGGFPAAANALKCHRWSFPSDCKRDDPPDRFQRLPAWLPLRPPILG